MRDEFTNGWKDLKRADECGKKHVLGSYRVVTFVKVNEHFNKRIRDNRIIVKIEE
jgi:hypothetical protein